jgi:hypothetical protein
LEKNKTNDFLSREVAGDKGSQERIGMEEEVIKIVGGRP